MLTDVTTLKPVNKVLPKWHYDNLKRISGIKNRVLPDEIYQAVIIAVHNESRGVIEPTIKSILNSNYDMKRIILTIAFEERGGVDRDGLAGLLGRFHLEESDARYLRREGVAHRGRRRSAQRRRSPLLRHRRLFDAGKPDARPW